MSRTDVCSRSTKDNPSLTFLSQDFRVATNCRATCACTQATSRTSALTATKPSRRATTLRYTFVGTPATSRTSARSAATGLSRYHRRSSYLYTNRSGFEMSTKVLGKLLASEYIREPGGTRSIQLLQLHK